MKQLNAQVLAFCKRRGQLKQVRGWGVCERPEGMPMGDVVLTLPPTPLTLTLPPTLLTLLLPSPPPFPSPH